MPAKKQKAVAPLLLPRKRIRTAERGADGLTFGERLEKCMEARSRALGRRYRQGELIADATRAIGRDPDVHKPIIRQQALSLILNNEISESGAAIAFAKVFGVEAMWLQHGIGPRSYLDSALQPVK